MVSRHSVETLDRDYVEMAFTWSRNNSANSRHSLLIARDKQPSMTLDDEKIEHSLQFSWSTWKEGSVYFRDINKPNGSLFFPMAFSTFCEHSFKEFSFQRLTLQEIQETANKRCSTVINQWLSLSIVKFIHCSLTVPHTVLHYECSISQIFHITNFPHYHWSTLMMSHCPTARHLGKKIDCWSDRFFHTCISVTHLWVFSLVALWFSRSDCQIYRLWGLSTVQ